MTEKEQRLEMITLARSLFERGYSVGGAGNISIRLDSQRVLITPTNSSLGRLKEEGLSIIDINGNHLEGDKPSKEYVFHLEILRNNSNCKSIVHLHSTYLTALSCLKNLNREDAIKAFSPYYVMRVGKLPVIPYYRPGDKGLAQELGERANESKAFLLANHGVVVLGSSLDDAVKNAEELEETAKLYFILQNQSIRYLSDQEILELKTKKP